MSTDVVRAVFTRQLEASRQTFRTFCLKTVLDDILILGLQSTETMLGEAIAVRRGRTREVRLGLAIGKDEELAGTNLTLFGRNTDATIAHSGLDAVRVARTHERLGIAVGKNGGWFGGGGSGSTVGLASGSRRWSNRGRSGGRGGGSWGDCFARFLGGLPPSNEASSVCVMLSAIVICDEEVRCVSEIVANAVEGYIECT